MSCKWLKEDEVFTADGKDYVTKTCLHPERKWMAAGKFCIEPLCDCIFKNDDYDPKCHESQEDKTDSPFNDISKPSHYAEGREYEPKDVIRDWGLNFNLGSAVKYISRAGRKDDIIQDLKKAQQFIQFEIDALEKEKK